VLITFALKLTILMTGVIHMFSYEVTCTNENIDVVTMNKIVLETYNQWIHRLVGIS
jgi:hypothetical protein